MSEEMTKEALKFESKLNEVESKLKTFESEKIALEQEKAKMSSELEAYKKEKRDNLVNQYKELAKSKSVEIGDVDKMSNEMITQSINLVKQFKVAEAIVEKPVSRAEVVNNTTVSPKENWDGIVLTQEGTSRGWAMYAEPYKLAEQYKRFALNPSAVERLKRLAAL